MDRASTLRALFAWYVARRAGARDPRIEAAFAAIPREPFAGPPPWHILPAGPWTGLRARSGIAGNLPAVDAVYVSAGLTQPEAAWLGAVDGRALTISPGPSIIGRLA